MSSNEKTDEFELIKKFFAPLASKETGAFKLGDDAAVLSPPTDKQLVFTTDGLTAGVHFLNDENPRNVATRLIGVNLSDLAAMGADPWVYTLALALPNDLEPSWLANFSKELKDLQERFSINLIGGDTTATSGPLTLSLTAIGTVPVGGALLRSGACAGDLIYVSGTIGDSTLGLAVLQGKLKKLNDKFSNFLAARYHRPEPRVSLGQNLRGIANAAIDVSDGLIADLEHLAIESGLVAVINSNQVPFSKAAISAFSLDPKLKEQAMTGGDDYELVFSISKTAVNKVNNLAKSLGLMLSNIGSLSHKSDEDKAVVRVMGDKGQFLNINKKGYRHFL